jgi:hypothetical protein
MKFLFKIIGGLSLISPLVMAVESPVETALATHQQGAAKVADRQDELAADVQQLTLEQTVPEVVKLLNEVGKIMDEATDKLTDSNTGVETLAAQTEVIEKIHAAAKEKQKKEGSCSSSSAMMDMMERMMGKKPETEAKAKAQGKDGKAGSVAGEGSSGLSDTASAASDGPGSGKSEARRVPKASGSAGRALPEEFRKALDAYNRGAEQKAK